MNQIAKRNKKIKETKKKRKIKKKHTRSRKQKGGEDEEEKKQERLDTSLSSAARIGSKKFVERVLKKGANVNAKTNMYTSGSFYEPPLIEAAQYGNTEIVLMLLDNGADVNIKGEFGNTALMAIINLRSHPEIYEKQKEIIKILLNAGIDVNIEDQYGRTAFELAELYELDDIAKLLREYIVKHTMQKHKEDQEKRLIKWSVMDTKKIPDRAANMIVNEYGGKRKTKKITNSKKSKKSLKNKFCGGLYYG